MTGSAMQRRTVLGGLVALGAAAGVGSAGVGAAAPEPARPDRKVALVTGTSSGFGRLIALTLAREGHRVFAAMRDTRGANAHAARELRALAGRDRLALHVIDIDVRDERSVAGGVRLVRQLAGRVDVLVNNAGIFFPAVLETMTVDDVRETFETNLFGHLRMNRAVLPAMRDQGEGLVVQITTGLGRVVLPFAGAYCGAKWALEAMTEVTRYELSRFGVDVVIVEPGAYNTDLVDPNGVAYYRRYLRRLTPENARRREDYGELARRAESHLVEDPAAPDPQQVADTVSLLVRTPRGQRPTRTFGPGLPEQWSELNEAARRVQLELLEAAGFGDLISIRQR
jgi:NAD(P)-dependent dehydrogenase (short-subunit alcohol dehydrogenase family)